MLSLVSLRTPLYSARVALTVTRIWFSATSHGNPEAESNLRLNHAHNDYIKVLINTERFMPRLVRYGASPHGDGSQGVETIVAGAVE